jgi:DNA-3-methyladenine glycosylase
MKVETLSDDDDDDDDDNDALLVPLPREWFERDALVLARALIGTRLVVRADEKSGEPDRVARIVETEAYCGPTDLACHARAVTERTKTMYGPPGHAYVYLIYGMYECFNIVCHANNGHAVLIRAVEPISGVPSDASTAGPGRLTRALTITRKDNAHDLVKGERIFVADRGALDPEPEIRITARVGVGYSGEWADRPWRFLDAKSRFVSKPPAKSIGRPKPEEEEEATTAKAAKSPKSSSQTKARLPRKA